MNRKTQFFLISLLLLIFACKRTAKVQPAGFILGPTNDIEQFQSSKASEQVRQQAMSVGLAATELPNGKRKFCTVWRFGNLMKTNFHCFAKTDNDGEVINEYLETACKKTDIHFNFDIDQRENVIQARCKEGSLKGDYVGDVATFELEGGIPDEIPSLELWPEEDIPAGRKLRLIHHPDIKAHFARVGEKRVNLPSKSITEENCETAGDFDTLERPLDPTLPMSTKITCDLIKGSSGAPAIDVETGLVMGMAWGGIDIKRKKVSRKDNAITKSYYLQAFVDGEVDAVRQTLLRETADAEAKREEEERAKKELSAENLEGALCGTLTAKGIPTSPMTLLLFLPLIIIYTRSILRN